MSYCSVEDLRNEGLDDTDEKLSELVELSCDFIDRITGQFFEQRELLLTFDGRGGQNFPLPYPLIEASEILCDDEVITDFVIYHNANYPKLYREAKWPKGIQNIKISGTWGYEVTPAPIKRIAIKLAMYYFPSLSDAAAQDELAVKGLITSETTDGHSYSLANVDTSSLITGDKEIDDVLKFYIRSHFRMAVC